VRVNRRSAPSAQKSGVDRSGPNTSGPNTSGPNTSGPNTSGADKTTMDSRIAARSSTTSSLPSRNGLGGSRDDKAGRRSNEPVTPAPAVEKVLVENLLSASRALVAIAARSLGAVGEDVTLPQFRALVVLATRGPQRLAELAQALGVDPSTATRMCDRLVRKELAYRRRTSDDRRGVRISLGPAGRDLVDEVTARRRYEMASVIGRLPANKSLTVLRGMRAFADAAGELPPSDWALGWALTTAEEPSGVN
jgi:DNA-binding MarR family transcriptional regulator